MIDYAPILIGLLAFGAVAGLVFVLGQQISTQGRVQQRVVAGARAAAGPERALSSNLDAVVRTFFD